LLRCKLKPREVSNLSFLVKVVTRCSGLSMFSATNELPSYLFHPDKRGHSYDFSTTPFNQCMRHQGDMFHWFGQKVKVGDLKQGKNGVGEPYDWLPDTMPAVVLQNGEASKPKKTDSKDGNSFRSGYPGAFGTYLQDIIRGKEDDELVERPEMVMFKMAMIGAGEAGLTNEYHGMCPGYEKLRLS
jgi:hypothetical protein